MRNIKFKKLLNEIKSDGLGGQQETEDESMIRKFIKDNGFTDIVYVIGELAKHRYKIYPDKITTDGMRYSSNKWSAPVIEIEFKKKTPTKIGAIDLNGNGKNMNEKLLDVATFSLNNLKKCLECTYKNNIMEKTNYEKIRIEKNY